MKVDIGENEISDVTKHYIEKASDIIKRDIIEDTPIELSDSYI
jgi:hypothetical protein